MKELILLSPIVLVVLVSGCTDICLPWDSTCGIVTGTSDVLIIKDITATPSTITAGQQTRITANIQNIGEEPIENFGDIEVKIYDYCKGHFEISSLDCPDAASGSKSDTCMIKSILPQEIRQVSWVLTADDVAVPTVCPEKGVKVYVRYHYITNGLTTIAFINPAERDRQLQEGTYAPTQSYSAVGEGPMKAIINVEDQQPIPAYDPTTCDTTSNPCPTTTISLQVKNDARGHPVPFSPEGDTEEFHINNESLTITFPDEIKTTSVCRFPKNGNTGMPNNHIRLIDSSSSKFLCEIESLPVDLVPKETTRTIEVQMEYDYEFRDKVKVTVQPSGALGSGG